MWNTCLERNLANYQEGKDYNHYICGFNALMNKWKSAIMFDKKLLNLDWSSLNEFLLSFQFLQKFFSAFDIWMNCQLLCHNFYFKLQRKNSLGWNWIVNCHIIISISHLKLEACVSRFVAYVCTYTDNNFDIARVPQSFPNFLGLLRCLNLCQQIKTWAVWIPRGKQSYDCTIIICLG